jgi:hypothetical protein
LCCYLSPATIKRDLKSYNSVIAQALLKYGPMNFGIRILEFIELDHNFSNKQQKKNHFG